MKMRKFFHILPVIALVLSFFASVAPASAGGGGNIGSGPFCHVPPGNPENEQQMNGPYQGHFKLVNGELVGQHGGDYLGQCDGRYSDPGDKDPGPQPPDKSNVYVIDGALLCVTGQVEQFQVTEVAGYYLGEDNKWHLGVYVETGRVAVEPRPMTEQELIDCAGPQPDDKFYEVPSEPAPNCVDGTMSTTYTEMVITYTRVGGDWVADEPAKTGETRVDTRDMNDAERAECRGEMPEVPPSNWSDWSTFEFTCDTREGEETRTRTTTTHVPSDDGLSWVAVEETETATRTVSMSDEERAKCDEVEVPEFAVCVRIDGEVEWLYPYQAQELGYLVTDVEAGTTELVNGAWWCADGEPDSGEEPVDPEIIFVCRVYPNPDGDDLVVEISGTYEELRDAGLVDKDEDDNIFLLYPEIDSFGKCGNNEEPPVHPWLPSVATLTCEGVSFTIDNADAIEAEEQVRVTVYDSEYEVVSTIFVPLKVGQGVYEHLFDEALGDGTFTAGIAFGPDFAISAGSSEPVTCESEEPVNPELWDIAPSPALVCGDGVIELTFVVTNPETIESGEKVYIILYTTGHDSEGFFDDDVELEQGKGAYTFTVNVADIEDWPDREFYAYIFGRDFRDGEDSNAVTCAEDPGNGGTDPDPGDGNTDPDPGNGGTDPDPGDGNTDPDPGEDTDVDSAPAAPAVTETPETDPVNGLPNTGIGTGYSDATQWGVYALFGLAITGIASGLRRYGNA